MNINDRGNLKNREKQGKEKSSFVKTKRTDKLLARFKKKKRFKFLKSEKNTGHHYQTYRSKKGKLILRKIIYERILQARQK